MESKAQELLNDDRDWYAKPISFSKLSEAFREGTEIVLRNRANPEEQKQYTWSPNTPDERAPFYALVDGGVVPHKFLKCEGMVLTLDRNVVVPAKLSVIKKLYDLPEVKFSPATSGIEGHKGRSQNLSEYKEKVGEIIASLKNLAFQNAKILEASDLDERFQILDDITDLHAEEKFLTRIGPLLDPSVSKPPKEKLLSDVLKFADSAGLSRKGLLVIAALQILFAPTAKTYWNAGRRLLKPTTDLKSKDLYNAISDIRILKTHALWSALGVKSCLLTGDIGVALLWSGLSVTCYENSNECVSMQITLRLDSDDKPQMFPSFTPIMMRQLELGPSGGAA